jgi:hypothetical protein
LENIHFSRKIYHFITDTKEIPKCLACEKQVKHFKCISTGYSRHCSKKCINNSVDTRTKTINTCIKKYGIKNGGGSKDSLEKIKRTNLERYGLEYNGAVEEFKIKRSKTNLEKYGTTIASKSQIVKDKAKKTIANKFKNGWISTGLKIKHYKGSNLYYQGSYELNFLNLCEELGIIKDISRGPSIEYRMDNPNNSKTYYPDFHYKPLNLIVEIKSSYTYWKDFDKTQMKMFSTILNGFDFLFIVDNDFSNFIKMLKNEQINERDKIIISKDRNKLGILC